MTDIATVPDYAVKSPKKASKQSDADILSVMRSRLDSAVSATSDSRENELEDLKFAAGSPDNNWQWPTEVQTARVSGDARPMLTINKLPQHIRQVTNDQRQNRPSGKVVPASSDADSEVADIFDDMIRHIEYDSNAHVAYDTACENQVTYGEGYFRIITEFEDENSFNQVIKIRRIRNSFSVYLDPMIQDPCGEDADWGGISSDITKTEYENKYKDALPVSSLVDMGTGDKSVAPWMTEDTIRIFEYFYTEVTNEKLNLYPDDRTAFEGSPEDGVYRKHFGEPIKSRPSDRKQIKWVKTNGYEILEQSNWAGNHIPIIRVVGNEFEVEGQIYVSGIVRNAKDAQRMYNYHASNEVEMIALAPKAPYVGAAGQFENFEEKWKTANTQAWPYLEYNPIVAEGTDTLLPPPQRSQPPMVQSGIIAAKNAASEDIKEATGQYNASLGQPSNERSGKAILVRQHEGDTSTYHYGDNLARAIRYMTKQLVYLIPKIYDTKRIVNVIGEDGKARIAHFDSDLKHPDTNHSITVSKVASAADPNTIIRKIYNPSIGKYGVVAITGPGFATKRQEALDGMLELVRANPELWKVFGDLIVKYMDWPGAREIVSRIQKTMDPKLLQGDDIDPALQQAQQQIQELIKELGSAHGMLQNVHNSIESKELSVKMYDAETKRIVAMSAVAQAAAASNGMQEQGIQDAMAGTIHAAIDSGHLMGAIPGTEGMMQPDPSQQGPQQLQEAPPQLDPNKVMTEGSKHILQANQHNQDTQMQASQQAHERDMAAQQPAPEPGGP